MRALTLCLVLLLWGSSAWGMTGNEWNKYNEDTHVAYIICLVEGWGYASWKDGDSKWRELYEPLNNCQLTRKMTVGQLVAIFDKYLKENPEQWNYSVASLVFRRLSAVCMDNP